MLSATWLKLYRKMKEGGKFSGKYTFAMQRVVDHMEENGVIGSVRPALVLKSAKEVDVKVTESQAKAISDDYGVSFAEGGNVKFVSDKDKYNTTWGRMGQRDGHDAVGSFDIKSNGKTWDGYLYNLDAFDKEYYAHLPLKDGEKLYRYRSRTTDIAGHFTVIKVNIKKGLVYFLVDSSADDDKNLVFETKGVKPVYMNLSESEKFAEGGKLPSATRQREMWVRGKEKEAYQLHKDGGGNYSFESYKKVMDAALKNYKPTSKEEYKKLLDDYDYVGAMLDDAESEEEKELYRRKLKAIGDKIHIYERSDEYAEGGAVEDNGIKLVDAEEMFASGGRVWTAEQKTNVNELDSDFEEAVKNKGIPRNSKEAALFWRSGGFQKRMGEIFGKKYAEGGAIEDNGIELVDAEEKYAEGGSIFEDENELDVDHFAQGGPLYKFKKGDKEKTRDGNIETVVKINSNGNGEKEEKDYS